MAMVQSPSLPENADPDDARLERAVAIARQLVEESSRIDRHASRRERSRRRRLARLIEDPAGKELTFRLTDEVARIDDDRQAARRLRAAVRDLSVEGFGPLDRISLTAAALVAPIVSRLVMPLVRRRLRAEADGVILAAEEPEFTRHVARRRSGGYRPNVNVLGEAILSADEADARLAMVLERITRPDVDHVSVKVSAICPAISPLAFDDTVDRVSERLRVLYRAALGTRPATFVNLDMEEYRDLGLTVEAFTRVLDEPEFRSLDAGIVLQAYLPDAHAMAAHLGEWARRRRNVGGVGIKVRLVKGANLAMEQVDAELHGWPLSTFGSKAEVDASYKAVLDILLDARFDDAVRVGLASHNLFDVAWGFVLRAELAERAMAHRLEFEMLEGMAPHQAEVVRQRAGGLVMYAPVATSDDFTAAIAYLVRRLDENTSPDNFLTHLFELADDPAAFDAQAERFVAAVRSRHPILNTTHRTQDRHDPSPAPDVTVAFANAPDTDFTRPANRRWLAEALAAHRPGELPPIDDVAGVDAAVAQARAVSAQWGSTSGHERALLLERVGDEIEARRGRLLAVMAHETHKTIAESDPEISEAVDFARYYARSAVAIDTLAADGLAHSAPLGTVVVAPPWNFPFAIAMGGVSSALAAGNCVILKPAPQAVACAAQVAECCWAAGVPRSVLQVVRVPDDDAGRRLVSHPDVDAVILTGAWETAQMFLQWRPSMRLHAETSGKNALVITAGADLDLAIRDLVRSAFGHAGQKCSAASLAIVEAGVYDDPRFHRRLRDAVLTLRTGDALDLTTDVGPLIGTPGDTLQRALTILEPGEQWLVQPRRLDGERESWTPGVRRHVAPGSWFHRTECFGPVLGLMRAEDLDHAIELQNTTDYGLTAGVHCLDDEQIARWIDQAQAGNLYVNRGTTGAIVQRQPFGGWKRSVVGPSAKAGGPHAVSTVRRWSDTGAPLATVHARFDTWMNTVGRAEHDPSALTGERNVLRYRSLPAGVLVRLGSEATERQRALLAAAATATGCTVHWSHPDESEAALIVRLAQLPIDRVRVVGGAGDDLRRAVHDRGIVLDEDDPVGAPEVELRRWLREQAVSITNHRHGRVGR